VRVRADCIAFAIVDGSAPVQVSVRGQFVEITDSEPVEVPLDGQGPVLAGEVRLQTGERRPDGSLITASVPQARPAG
jgi:alpha,alpha-trehalose phosphorylase